VITAISNRPTKEITMGWVKKDSQYATGTSGRVSANITAQNARKKADEEAAAKITKSAKKGTGVRR
jgi:hypothetical protein